MYQLRQLIARRRMCLANLLVSDCDHLVGCFRLYLPVQRRLSAFRAQKFQLVLILVYVPSIYLKFRQNYWGVHLRLAQLRVYANHN